MLGNARGARFCVTIINGPRVQFFGTEMCVNRSKEGLASTVCFDSCWQNSVKGRCSYRTRWKCQWDSDVVHSRKDVSSSMIQLQEAWQVEHRQRDVSGEVAELPAVAFRLVCWETSEPLQTFIVTYGDIAQWNLMKSHCRRLGSNNEVGWDLHGT